MKLAIYSHNRTGSTFLSTTIARYLIDAGVIPTWAYLDEAFDPRQSHLISEDGILKHPILYPRIMNDEGVKDAIRKKRFELFKEHAHQDYVIRLQVRDAEIPGCVEWMKERYPVICIERRNPLSAFLSSLIAQEHQIWNVSEDKDRPKYHKFRAKRGEQKGAAEHFIRYYRYRNSWNPKVILYYEDIVSCSVDDMLEMAGVKQPGISSARSQITIKLQSFQEKCDTIENIVDVIKFFMTTVGPYVPDYEMNRL